MMWIAWTPPVSFQEPRWLWLALLVPLLAAVSLRSLAGLDPVRRVLSIIMRSLVILVIAAALARVEYIRTSEELAVIFLLDRSDSVANRVPAQEAYIAEVCKKIPKDDWAGVIDFAQHAYLEQLPMKGGYFLEQGRLAPISRTERTDIAGAIRLALAMFPPGVSRRIVLISDGNDNMGDVLHEVELARADGTVIDVAPLWYERTGEVFFDRMIAPTRAEEGEQVPIRMNLVSLRDAVTGRIVLKQNGRDVELPDEVARVTLKPGNNPFIIKLPVQSGGAQRFTAEFIPDEQRNDAIYDNNRATAFSYVAGKGRVLILTDHPEQDQPLLDALRSEHVDAEIAVANSFEIDGVSLLEYGCIILANVSANNFTDEQLQLLAGYVRDFGGGLVMTGGDESFGAGGWIGTPVEEVLPVQLEIKHKKVIPRGALVLIMHSCEIARGNEYGIEVAKKSVDTISSRDYIGVVAFTGFGVSWEVPLQIASNKGAIKSRIDRMMIGDMPSFAPAMETAVKDLRATDAAQKHMIIISDGDPQQPAISLLQLMAAEKITCSTVAIGYGRHVVEAPMRQIANITGGTFYPCNNPRELPQIFVKESQVVRRPLIIEEPFTPQQHQIMSELLTGIGPNETLPPLGGLVLTSPKQDPRVQLALVRATTDGNDPVLAHWQEGLGKSVAFTSGFWPFWGGDWTNWPKFAKFWAQLARWTMRQDASADFDTFTTIEGNTGRVVVEALDKDTGYLNLLNLQSGLIGPDGRTISMTFNQTGPGHYEATFPIDQSGQYIVNVGVSEGDNFKGMIHTGLSIPFSPEYRELATNESLLRRIADTAGGRWLNMDPATDDVFNHDLPPTIARQPVWPWVVSWLLLPLFLLDVAVRRLASWLALSIAVEMLLDVVLLFGAGYIYRPWWSIAGVLLLGHLVGWLIRFRSFVPMLEFFTHTVVTLGQTGERSTVALEQLRTKRDRLREDGATAPGGEPVATDTTRPTVAADLRVGRSKIDVDVPAESGPAKDLREVLGGAEVTGPAKDATRPLAPDKKESPEDVTARLLRAKRRVRPQDDDKPAL